MERNLCTSSLKKPFKFFILPEIKQLTQAVKSGESEEQNGSCIPESLEVGMWMPTVFHGECLMSLKLEIKQKQVLSQSFPRG